MSNDLGNGNPTLAALRRINGKFDDQSLKINEFMERQAHGDEQDPELFLKLLGQKSITKDALQAQFKLHEKPLKTVMNETK